MALTQTTRFTAQLLRFDRVQRSAHWANAGLFGLLMFTAIPLYFGSFFGLVMQRHLVAQIHLWSGLALPLPVIVSLVGPWGHRMRGDVRRINYWTRNEIEWLRTLGRAPLETDKFNPGQKLNSIFIGAVIILTLATGSVLQWFRLFPVNWRVGATFVHDVLAYAIFAAVTGHVILAVTHPQSLRSIFTGRVSGEWAARHAPRWLKEENSSSDASKLR